MMNPSKIAFIVNGAKKKANATINEIRRIFSGYSIDIFLTRFSGHAIALAASAVSEGAQAVVSVGGDGTLNEVLNGFLQGCENTLPLRRQDLFLGIVSMGTGNDFVRNLGNKATLPELKRCIDEKLYQKTDIGMAEFTAPDSTPGVRYFINISDIGIGGVIAEKISRYSRRLGATVTYQRAIFSAFMTYAPQPISVQTDTEHVRSNMMGLVIANGKHFGNGLGIAPFGEINDGFFDVVMLKNITLVDYLLQMNTVKKCQPIRHPEVSYSKTKSLTADSLSIPLPIDMDGEFIGYTPVHFSVLPLWINILTAD